METTTELPLIVRKWANYQPIFESTVGRVPKAGTFLAGLMLGLAILSLPIFAATIFMIRRHKMMHLSIKIYVVSDILCRLQFSLCLCYFSACLFDAGTFCIHRDGGFFSGFRINNFVSCVALALQRTTLFFQLALALNRFLAIYFDGKYFEMASSKQWLQVFLIVFIPLVLFFSQCTDVFPVADGSIVFGGPLFDTRIGGINQFDVIHHDWREHLKSVLDYMSVSLDVVMLAIDFAAFMRTRKRKTIQTRAERRLLAQILLNHLIYFLSVVFSWYFGSSTDPFQTYTMLTILTPFWNIIYSCVNNLTIRRIKKAFRLVVAYFMLPPRRKEQIATIQDFSTNQMVGNSPRLSDASPRTIRLNSRIS